MITIKPFHPRHPWTRACCATALLLAACGSDSEVPTFSDDELRAQGCDLDRVSTAYRATDGATGEATDARDAPTVIACAHYSGLGSSENTVAITSDGTVLVAPAFTEDGFGVLRTRDHGASWEPVLPNEHGGATHDRVQPYMHIDNETDRILYVTAAGGIDGAVGFDLSITDDGGDSWTAGTVGEGTVDWIKMISATPVDVATDGYPNAMYAAAPAPISTPSPLSLPEYQQVQRSLDGGRTWQDVAGEQLSLDPVDHGCPANEWVIYGGGVSDSDGVLYYGFRRCARLGIAISRDDGVTWTVNDVPGATLVEYGGLLSHQQLPNLMVSEPLAVDADNNLYALWADENDALRFAVSRDGAQTWSAPIAVAAPEATHAIFGAMAVREPGTVALAYYGSADGLDYHGYIAETRNALDAHPTFSTITINEPSDPLFKGGFDMGYNEVLQGGDLIEIAQIRYAPNGDLWAGFVQDMCPGSGNRGECTWDKAAHADSPYQGVAGRVVHR